MGERIVTPEWIATQRKYHAAGVYTPANMLHALDEVERLQTAAKHSARAERILAALREPSFGVVDNACLALFGADWARNDPSGVVWRADARQRFIAQLSAAVAAAEQEVGP